MAESEAKLTTVESRNQLRVRTAVLEAKSNQAEAWAQVAGQIARAEEEKTLEEIRIELNRSRQQVEVVVPAEAAKTASELQARGEASRILEDGRATAEAVKLMREQWEKGNTRDLFLIQLLPEIVEKVSHGVSDNLAIEKLTVVDSGGGNGVLLW